MPHESSPIGLHTTMFIPAIAGQGSDKQRRKWLPLCESYRIVGTYAQTEVGHGTFVRGLETTATYDPQTEQFIINSPTLTSTKWWPGNLGKTTNHAVVLAQLYTGGKCHGIHAFIVQHRDMETHQPLPGVEVGDIGPKFGYEAVDNGFLRYHNVRIPRDNMLMRYSEVTKDGRYIRKANEKLTYGTMVFVRSAIVSTAAKNLGEACTIAIRYSAVRRQSEMKPGEPEPQVLDYQTQQHKLFPLLATSYAYWFAGRSMRETYLDIQGQIMAGDFKRLPELHALSAGLKAMSTWATNEGIETCRLSCGGHGYSHASGLPKIYVDATPACTYEGENTVMMLQTARYLMKACGQAAQGNELPGFVAYLNQKGVDRCMIGDDLSLVSLVSAYQHRARRLIGKAALQMKAHMERGQPQEVAWNLASVQLVHCAKAHVQCYVLKNFVDSIEQYGHHEDVARVLTQLCQLFAVDGILNNAGDFLQGGFMSYDQLDNMTAKLLDLLAAIRPNAVALVDAFDFSDHLLQSVLGRYDGNVYENMLEWAKSSPLNDTQVHDSYYQYMQPFLKEMHKSKL
ncbi:peroxisomal acyl-coenzyme A oxidase 1 isoform X1 [Lingula anatina]|uniref:Acyl-coenzyme A oxidase n=1 Tax=Lingula anatina TaxID=7574 RepID=A0A1S3ITL9_LINAN|nr:peroxisomal acyl-coenzyme A oxidase 1 isoform X1 [Lingula anatina]|eukprot:XP_013401428.1 peroxisomal acyl-coenzyme A oxidase 1 isoform X1 [Lingula anatina]